MAHRRASAAGLIPRDVTVRETETRKDGEDKRGGRGVMIVKGEKREGGLAEGSEDDDDDGNCGGTGRGGGRERGESV